MIRFIKKVGIFLWLKGKETWWVPLSYVLSLIAGKLIIGFGLGVSHFNLAQLYIVAPIIGVCIIVLSGLVFLLIREIVIIAFHWLKSNWNEAEKILKGRK